MSFSLQSLDAALLPFFNLGSLPQRTRFYLFFFLVLTHEPSMFPVVLKKARGCV